MTDLDTLLQIAREGLFLVLVVSAPPVLVSLAVGLIVGVFQATTQLSDHTIGFVPKLIAVAASLVVAGPWIGAQLTRFTETLYRGISAIP